MSGVKMRVAAMTDVGCERTTNEDAFAITDLATGRRIETGDAEHAIDVADRGVLLALSDGMGGAQAGDVASALVVDTLHRALERAARGQVWEQLEEAVQRANQRVFEAARSHACQGMGATVTAVFVCNAEAYIAEVGDSRAYLLRNGRLRQITRDQSLVQVMLDQGILTPDEARSFPSKNVILQAVGLSSEVRVAIARLELRRHDRLLVCSDGITNAVADAELLQIVRDRDPQGACRTMIELANARGGEDNQTAIVAELTGDALAPPDEFETVTETYDVLKSYSPKLKGNAAELDAAASGIRPAPPAPAPPPPRAAGAPHAAAPAAPAPLPRASARAAVGARRIAVIVGIVAAALAGLAVFALAC